MSLHWLMFTGFSEARVWHSNGLGDGGWCLDHYPWMASASWLSVLIWASLSLHFCTGWQGPVDPDPPLSSCSFLPVSHIANSMIYYHPEPRCLLAGQC